jgi:large subunit ribosomal protein L4
MATVNVQSPAGDLTRTVELPDSVFGVQVNVPLIHQVVVAQLAAARQGTHDTKTRGEVSGGGRKPYRQKGTGRARQGSTRAPQFSGGGTVHGPTPRDYSQRTPKKMKAAALRGALSDRARGGRLHVVSELLETDTPSTKTAAAALAKIVTSRNVLFVAEREDILTWKSLRNVPSVHLIAPDQLNTYDVLVSEDVVFTEGALARFLKQPAPEAPAKPAAKSTEKPAAQEAAKPETETTAKPATDAGTTEPAGAGVSDEKAVEEVAEQTSPDLKAEPVFEAAADKDTEEPAETALADELLGTDDSDDEPTGGES